MTIQEQYANFNPYTLGNFFIASYKGKLGVFHSYVDTGLCYGYRETLSECEKLLEQLKEQYKC